MRYSDKNLNYEFYSILDRNAIVKFKRNELYTRLEVINSKELGARLTQFMEIVDIYF